MDFYEAVMRRARLTSPDEARRVAAAVVRNLGQALGGRTSARLLPHLPGELAGSLPAGAAASDETMDAELFVGPLVGAMDTQYGYDATLGGMDLVSAYADNDAATQVKAVFASLKERLDPALRQDVAAALPPPVADWWRQA